MKPLRILGSAFSFLTVLALIPANFLQPAQVHLNESDISRETQYLPGEIVIGLASSVPEQKLEAKASALAGKVGASVEEQTGNLALLRLDNTANISEAVAQLAEEKDIQYAHPNYIFWIPEEDVLGPAVDIPEYARTNPLGVTQLAYVDQLAGQHLSSPTYPNDEWANWGNQWMGHEIIWKNRNASPTVCLLDTGVDNRHPDLRGRVINGYDFVNNDKTSSDDNGHGTHLAGIISAGVNNRRGLAGISNGRVLAVKVLRSQGWGTSFDVASGIYYCADKSYVKVILTGFTTDNADDEAIYNALKYAIEKKDKYDNSIGKLVIAAAGNQSSSSYEYPAAWAVSANKGPNNATNQIHHGLISVGAVRRDYFEGESDIWIDVNNNDTKEFPDEVFNQSNCATDFTNYGSWVEMVAPGESIYSTTPVSYPFHLNFFDEVSSGYDWLNGTSMAAAHAAGAAARTWSVYPKETYDQIHTRLIAGGETLSSLGVLAVEFDIMDASAGYNGGSFGPYDEDNDPLGTLETIKAPFCWPYDHHGYGPGQDMSNSVVLNVAGAMDRGAVLVKAVDATTALPLLNANARAISTTTNKMLSTGKQVAKDFDEIHLLNLPAGDTYRILVSKGGYTAGYQEIGQISVSAGSWNWNNNSIAGIPPNKEFTAVLNWDNENNTNHDIDLYVFLPANANAVVGSGYSRHNDDIGPGSLRDFPYAIYYRDGGNPDPDFDGYPVESITISRYPKKSYPYFTHDYPNENYDLLVNGRAIDTNDSHPVLRVWYGGKVILAVEKTDVCSVVETWWLAGSLSRSGNYAVGTSIDTCGTDAVGGGGVWPYANNDAIFGLFGESPP